MDVFFSDLDNTLIYSHRHRLHEDKIPIEYLNGREQSFMARITWDTLVNLTRFTLVPVSSRTEPQYFRLICMEELHPRYAIICNGGKLLIDGREDKLWTDETNQITASSEKSIKQAVGEIIKISPGSEVHSPERYMHYVSVELPERVRRDLSGKINTDEVDVRCDRRKVYLFSKGVNKGQAVRRFVARFDVENTIAAGDNEMDIAMLNEVGFALAAEEIFSDVTAPRKIKLVGEDYSSQICEVLKNLINEGKT